MHNFNIIKKEMELCGSKITFETGRIAKQANGAVLATQGETTILVTATMGPEPTEFTDFFPLTVDFIEKMYAAGKIPGGFFKREAKPSTTATLNARIVDRSIRPLFPEGFRNAVHVVVTVLSFDEINDPGILSVAAASAALGISDIPFNGVLAGITVGQIDGKFVVNPDFDTLETKSMLNLTVTGSEQSIVMIEAASTEITEEEILEAVYLGHAEIKKIIAMQKEFIAEARKEKIVPKLDLVPEELMQEMTQMFGDKVKEAAQISGKLARNEAFDAVGEEVNAFYLDKLGKEEFETQSRWIANGYHDLIKKFVRHAILYKQHRVDGRSLDEVRDITCEIDIVPRVHGTALFTRGETQSFGAVTLGSASGEQIIDGLNEEFKKNFYLHYNFPPFSVGEAGFMRGPGRRELGHGNLAERALNAIMPDKESFPYTIRVVSEITESNGSSSQATICSGSLALMAAGVPVRTAVAGIANGLIMEGNDFVVLTDIMGLEDHLGDMDFKVAGTKDGITAMQMDIKIEGITKEIMAIALKKAHVARMHILEIMNATISEPRPQLSPYAPAIEAINVPTDKIGEIIGPGGKNIKAIIEATSAEIDIQDSGLIRIFATNAESMNAAKEMISNIYQDPEMNAIYKGIITRVESYGVFVKFMGGSKEGLVHVSNLDERRISSPASYLFVGDTVNVR
ncbi:MAG: polyribonucleotide nucleotidyltransferase, partial [Candidatus Cloacimonetes bacterium]|nr:polyribonucleotide nucleotidyltransferase [Candidatus Cloacimonadota bacterium]